MAETKHTTKPQPTETPEVEESIPMETADPKQTHQQTQELDHEKVKSQLSEVEDELLKSPKPAKDDIDSTTEKFEQLKVKRKNPSLAERKAAILAKLAATGQTWDSSKWKRSSQARRQKKQVDGKTSGSSAGAEDRGGSAKRSRGHSTTPPSSEAPSKRRTMSSVVKRPASDSQHKPQAPLPGPSSQARVSYRDMTTTKMAIALQNFPTSKLTLEQGELLEDAIIDEVRPLEDGTIPSFSGSYMEKGALILCCLSEATSKWLEALIPRIKPLGEEVNLIVGLRKDVLRTTRVFFRAHPKLSKRTPQKIIEMLDTLNRAFKVKEWRILPAQADEKGYGFVCFLDDDCYYKAVTAANFQANLGLWQVSIVTSTVKDNAGAPDKSAPQ